VDALPPPHVPDHGAYIAPATQKTEPVRAQLLTARLGLGVGTAGEAGFAGTYFGQIDFWPLKFVGLGVEAEASGSDSPGLFQPSPSASYNAMRVRGGLRVPIALQPKPADGNPPTKLIVLSAGVGVGRGSATRTTYSSAPCDDTYGSCDTSWSTTDYVANREHKDRTTVSVELALRFQMRVLEVGMVARYQNWDDASLFTLGPTFGVGL